MFAFDRPHQVGLGAEVVTDRGVVSLAGGLADLPVRHRENPVLGEQPLRRREDCFSRGAGPVGPYGSFGGGGHDTGASRDPARLRSTMTPSRLTQLVNQATQIKSCD